MSLRLDERYSAAVIQIQGKFLGSLEGDQFRAMLQSLKEAGRTNVVVDLSRTDFMDSSALGVLIGGLTTMRREGGDIRLACIEKRIKNLFLITRMLGPVFQDYATVAEAEMSYRDHPPAPPAEA